jgi:LysM repeat protein
VVVKAPAVTAKNYTIKSGDSLWSISKAFNVSVDSIKAENKIKNDGIIPGQRLIIPQASGTKPAAPAQPAAPAPAAKADVPIATPPAATAPTTAISYLVKAGDSLWVIAKTFNVSVESIKTANNLSGDTIFSGQSLLIPQSASGGITYRVKPGDKLWDIARTYAVSIESIKAANNLNSDYLLADQEIIIPTTNVFTGNLKRNLNWMIEVQYNLTSPVFHDVSVPYVLHWAPASREQISYYANPANFVNDPNG